MSQRKFKLVWVLVYSWLIAILPLAAANAATKAAVHTIEKVRIAYSSISGNMAPLWAAYEGGFFRKYGIDAELVFIEGGGTTVKSLASGDVAFAQMAGAGVIQSNLQGDDVVMIAGVVNTLTFQLIVDKNIDRPARLKGKAAAVTRSGSSTDFAMRYALEKYGLQPDKDVTISELGSMPAILTALQTGKAQAAMLSAPTTLKAKKMGFPVLANLQMLGLQYQHTGMATTRSLIKSRPDLVRAVMKAYVEGIHYYKTHPEEAVAILRKYLKTDDPEALTEVYEDIGLTLIPEKPYPTVRGIEIMLQELAAKDGAAHKARPEQFVDLTFVKELDSSGFIDGLYKTAPARVASEERRPAHVLTTVKKPEQAPAAARGMPRREKISEAQEHKHTVQAGDTLSHLALRYYGRAYKWTQIYEANRETMENPHYLYIGQKIIVPPEDTLTAMLGR
jgi:NitT/TauT family transport system substrate-binding protein